MPHLLQLSSLALGLEGPSFAPCLLPLLPLQFQWSMSPPLSVPDPVLFKEWNKTLFTQKGSCLEWSFLLAFVFASVWLKERWGKMSGGWPQGRAHLENIQINTNISRYNPFACWMKSSISFTLRPTCWRPAHSRAHFGSAYTKDLPTLIGMGYCLLRSPCLHHSFGPLDHACPYYIFCFVVFYQIFHSVFVLPFYFCYQLLQSKENS